MQRSLFHRSWQTTWLTLLAVVSCANGREAPAHTCRIVFLDRPDDAPRTLYLFDGATSREVELPGMNLSPVYKLPPGALNLRLLATPASDPKTISPDAPAVLVPEASTDFYLLVTSDRKNPVAPVRLNVINADETSLGRGQMLWFNLTDKAIAGTVGKEKITLKPGARELMREPHSGKGDYPVDLYFRIKGDDFIHPLCETQWHHDPRSRALVFIMPESDRRVPRLIAFSDFRPTEDPKDKSLTREVGNE